MHLRWAGVWVLSIVISVAAVSTGMFLENTVEKSRAYDILSSNEFTLEIWCSLPLGSFQRILYELKNLPHVDSVEGTIRNTSFHSNPPAEGIEGMQDVKFLMQINSIYLMDSQGVIEIQSKLKGVGEAASEVISSHGGIVEEMEYPMAVSYYWWVPYMPLLNGLNIGLLTIIFCIYAGAVGLEAKIWAGLREEERSSYGKGKRHSFITRHMGEQLPDIIMVALLAFGGYVSGMAVMWLANEFFLHMPTFKPGIYLDEIAMCVLIATFIFTVIVGLAKIRLRKRALMWGFRDLPGWRDESTPWRAITFTTFPVVAGTLVARGPLLRGVMCLLCVLFLHLSVAAFIISVIYLSWLATVNMDMLRNVLHRRTRGNLRKAAHTSNECFRGCLRRDRRVSRCVAAASLLTICVIFLSAIPDTLNETYRLEQVASIGGDVKIYLPEISNLTLLYGVLSDDRLVLSYSFIAYPPAVRKDRLFSEDVTYMDRPWFGITDFSAYSNSIYDVHRFIREGELKRGCAVISEMFAIKERVSVGDVVSTAAGDFTVSCIMYRIPGVDAEVLIDSPSPVFNISHQDVIIKARDPYALKAALDSLGIYYQTLGADDEKTPPDLSFHLLYLVPAGYLLMCALYLSICSDYSGMFRECIKKHGSISLKEALMFDGFILILGVAFVGLVSGLSFAYFMMMEFTTWWLLPTFILGPTLLIYIPLLFIAYLLGMLTAVLATLQAVFKMDCT